MKRDSTKNLFQTIIVGVDFSRYSKIVFKQAIQLAEQFNAKLVLAYADYNEWQVASPEIPYVPQVSLKDLTAEVERFYHIRPSPKLSVEVRRGLPETVVLGIAKQYPQPLIIVGSQGKNAISRYLLGSHAEAIALKSKYPVWVHRGNKIVPFKKVLIPTDFSKSSNKQIDQIKDWKNKIPLSLRFLYVKPEALPILNYPAYMQVTKEIKNTMKNSLNQFRRRNRGLPVLTLSGMDPSEKISSVGRKYDVIAMNPHNRSGLFHRFGRVTSKVIRLSNNPILVMR